MMELSFGYWAPIGSSSDHIIILPVGCWSWKELVVDVLVVDSFEFNYTLPLVSH